MVEPGGAERNELARVSTKKSAPRKAAVVSARWDDVKKRWVLVVAQKDGRQTTLRF